MNAPAYPGPGEGDRPGRGLVFLAEDVLADMVGLPEGWRVTGVDSDFARVGVLLLVESPDLERVQPGCIPPTLAGAFDTEYLLDDGGGDGGRRRVWVRWQWRPGEPRERPEYACGFGPCAEPARLALAVHARRDVYSPEAGPCVLLLCEGHAGAPPAGWDGLHPPGVPAGEAGRREGPPDAGHPTP